MIGFMLSDDTQIVKLKTGHLKYMNKNEILVLRNDKTPIFLIRDENSKINFYELDNLTKNERENIDNIYLMYLMNICDEIKSFIALTGFLDMIDYNKVLDITKFKDGELMVA
jgi:hypothetical protein